LVSSREVSVRAQARAGPLLTRAHLLIPGVYAWLATVASPTLGREAPPISKLTAFSALIALVAGPYLAVERPRLGRGVGISLFVALCSVTWLVLADEISIDRIEPVQAALGGLGWAAFAFGWGSLRQLGAVPEDHPNVLAGAALAARGTLPKGALFVLGLSILGAISCLALAWRVPRPDHALLAHAAAVACAIALLGGGAKVATLRGPRQPEVPPRRISAARRWLVASGLLLLIGGFWQVIH
jgi:hypothetical protein